jgi:acyl-CoA thioester hydrolase
MTKPNISAQIEIEVPFFDVDSMDIVWHGHYAKYFELARCKLLDSIDYNYTTMRQTGYAWPIIDLRIRYAHPMQFGQIVIVSAELTEWENRLGIRYRIVDKATGKRLTRGQTYQVAVDMHTREMCFESPDILWQKLGLQKT